MLRRAVGGGVRRGAAGEHLAPAERGRGRRVDFHAGELTGAEAPSKLTALLWLILPRIRVFVGPAGALDEDLHGSTDETLRALPGTALDQLDERLHPLAFGRVRDLVRQLCRFGAAAGREDEREGAVVTDLVDQIEGLGEVVVGLAGKPTMMSVVKAQSGRCSRICATRSR